MHENQQNINKLNQKNHTYKGHGKVKANGNDKFINLSKMPDNSYIKANMQRKSEVKGDKNQIYTY